MKKKFRNITIDGDKSWAWTMRGGDNYYKITELVIWKDKKVKYQKCFGYNCESGDKSYPITPKLVSKFIKKHLI